MSNDKNTILIVEDEVALREALKDKLERENFEIVEAKNGQEGLQVCESVKPDLILLDIVMPVKDGLTMLKELRETDWGKNLPVILLTNLSDNEKVAEALASGSHDYLVKSDWKLEDVVERIRERLK